MLKHRKINHVLHKALLLGLFISIALMGTFGHAAGPYKGEWVLPNHYPNGFDGWGRIDRLADHEVVIDDTSHALSAAVIYNTPTSSHIPASWFHVGDLVGYLKNGNNEIISLWRIP
jgi:hypothetical protein